MSRNSGADDSEALTAPPTIEFRRSGALEVADRLWQDDKLDNGVCCERFCISWPTCPSCCCCSCNCCCCFCRRKVSKAKRRFEEKGFSLDLAYVTPRIITHGFPATSLEHFYRNPRSEVRRFLDKNYGEKYFVFNFCAEPGRKYASSTFHGRVKRFPYWDHQVPSLQGKSLQSLSYCKIMMMVVFCSSDSSPLPLLLFLRCFCFCCCCCCCCC